MWNEIKNVNFATHTLRKQGFLSWRIYLLIDLFLQKSNNKQTNKKPSNFLICHFSRIITKRWPEKHDEVMR